MTSEARRPPKSRFAAADALVAEAVASRVCSAAVLAVYTQGAAAHQSAFGALEPGGPVADVETIFDLASLTKPVVATTLLTLVEGGTLGLDQTVGDVLPDCASSAFGHVTLLQLATHTSGLPAWVSLYEHGVDREGALAALRVVPLEADPGARYLYSDLGYILLGECIARGAGRPLQDAVTQRVLAPLGMTDTTYGPRHDTDRIARTGNCALRAGCTLAGEVHDANARALGGVAGHAGLFGTVADLGRFALCILGCDIGEGKLLLRDDTLRLARENQLRPEVGGQSIGWFTPPNPLAPSRGLPGPRVFGHSGFTGTLIACDPDLELAVVLLTNRVLMSGDNQAIVRLRSNVLAAVRQAL